MRTAANLFLGAQGQREADQILNLPDEIMVKILGFLDVFEAFNSFAITSRRCRAAFFEALTNPGADVGLRNFYERITMILFIRDAKTLRLLPLELNGDPSGVVQALPPSHRSRLLVPLATRQVEAMAHCLKKKTTLAAMYIKNVDGRIND